MSLRESIANKLEAQINSWNKQLDYYKAKAEEEKAEAENQKADAEVKHDSIRLVEELKSNIRKAQSKLDEVKNASEDRLTKVKKDVESWLH